MLFRSGQSIGESEVEPGAESDAQLSTEPSTEPTGAESNIEPDAESRMRLNAEPSAELNVEPSLSSAQVRKVSEGEPEKPKHRCKRLLIICGILVVVAVVILISLAIVGSKKPNSPNNYRPNSLNNYRPNSPEDIMVRYLHDKYGKDFKLVGEMTHNSASSVVGGYYASDAHPVDNPRIRFEVVLDGGNVERKYKKSDDYIKASRTVLEEDRLRPYIERIFGKDAEFGVRFDSGVNSGNWVKFNVVEGANHTNITGISIINGDLFIKGASYVTVDDIYMKANMSGVGAGTGFLSIHSNAYYTTVKNSKFENGGTGSSCVVLGKGGKYATFDNNEFLITGSSGNVLSSNIFVGSGEIPQFVNYTNNIINSQVPASPFMYGITVCGQGNIIENNSILNFKGNAIVNQWGATSTENIYRNNTITGGGSMSVGTYSLVENNNIAEGALTATEGCTLTGNTVKSLTIDGKNVVASKNTILTTVNVGSAAKNTTFTENNVSDLVTVNSNDNIITGNFINSITTEYAIDLKSTTNNTVVNNILHSSALTGNSAVTYQNVNNTVKNNFPIDPKLSIQVENILVGQNAEIHIKSGENISIAVEVILDGKKYSLNLVNGEAILIVSGLNANTYTVSAYSEGNLFYMHSNCSNQFTVDKLAPDVNVAIGEIKLGEDVIVSINIPHATGNVNVIVDGVGVVVSLDVNGNATYTIDSISAGNHSVVVAYLGDNHYLPKVESIHFNVSKEIPEVNIIVPGDIKVGEDVKVTVNIPHATGNVSIIVDGIGVVV